MAAAEICGKKDENMKKQGLKIRAALFLVTAALASSPVLTSVAAATKKDVSSAKDKKKRPGTGEKEDRGGDQKPSGAEK
ncbi:MAG: hypothetical protein ACLT76_11040 [Clostridium fessum]